MSRVLHIAAAALLVAAGSLNAAAAAAELKIATIRTDRVLREAPQAEEIRAKLKADFERRAQELQAEAQKLAEDMEKYQREKAIMSTQDRANTEKRLYERRVDLQLKQETLQKEASSRERELTIESMQEIEATIDEVAKARGVDLVIRDPVYIRDGLNIDITDEVLKRLGEKTGSRKKK